MGEHLYQISHKIGMKYIQTKCGISRLSYENLGTEYNEGEKCSGYDLGKTTDKLMYEEKEIMICFDIN